MDSTEPPVRGSQERRRLVTLLVARAQADPELHGLTAALQRVCRAVTDSLDLRGAAVHVISKADGAAVAACSDADARAVAELQFTTNEGPTLVAFQTQRPVLVPALDSVAARWPGFASLAIERGVRGLFAFPLQEGAVSFGVLELYADRAGPLDADQQAMARAFARAATDVLLDGGTVTATGGLDAGLSASFGDRARIHQAQGMVDGGSRHHLGRGAHADACSRLRRGDHPPRGRQRGDRGPHDSRGMDRRRLGLGLGSNMTILKKQNEETA